MNTDDKLRQHFQALRTADAQHTPIFSRAVRSPLPAATIPWLRLAAVAALLVVLIVTVTTKRHSVADTQQQWTTLSNWRATTDTLLIESSTPWSSTISTPTDSLIENANQTNQKQTL